MKMNNCTSCIIWFGCVYKENVFAVLHKGKIGPHSFACCMTCKIKWKYRPFLKRYDSKAGFFHTFSVLALLGIPGNLRFWIFYLSFCEYLLRKSRLFWMKRTWVLEKLGWVLPKMAKTWNFLSDLSFPQKVKKKAWIIQCFQITRNIFYKGQRENETSLSLIKIRDSHCCIDDVIASLLLNKAPKIETN